MRRLTILRPEPGASASLALAKELGIEAVSVPLFRIEPIEWTKPEAGGFDALLLTSANAVRFGGPALAELRGLKVHAVGEATAAAARDSGFGIASVGSSGVERLLGSIEPGQKLLHLCGEERTAFSTEAQHVTAIPVYRAAEAPVAGSIGKAEVVALHSARAARRFAELVPDGRSAIAIAAISSAAAQAAGHGWQQLCVADSPDDRSLLALAKELCEKPAR